MPALRLVRGGYPLPAGQPGAPIGGGRLVPTEPLRIATGGIVSNAGVAMARLGMKTAAFTYVGRDEWAGLIRDRLEAKAWIARPCWNIPRRRRARPWC